MRTLKTPTTIGIFGALAIGVIGLATAQDRPDAGAQGPEIRDKSGGTWVRGWSKMRGERLADGKLKYIVRANPGKKILGSWKQEGLDVEVGELDFLVSSKGGTFDLLTATMGGGIEAKFTRPSAGGDAKASQVATITASSAEYSGAKSTVDVKGSVQLVREDPGASQHMTASGSSGVIVLSKPGEKGNAVQSATLNGPVVMKLNGTRKGDDGKPQKYDVNGRANQMVFNDAARTVVFSGTVKISGDDPSLGGQISGVSKVVITFTPTGEVESIDMDGDPIGTTTISDKRKGGGKR